MQPGSLHNANSSRQPFLAFVSDTASSDTLRQFAATHFWPDSIVQQGDITHAAAYLRDHASPEILLVEITSVADASAQLNALADVCDPSTKVIVTGTVNEYSFYCWLMEIGISSYLLKPMTVEQLENAYKKSTGTATMQPSGPKQAGKVIAVTGTRGGVGTTTVAVNLGYLIAKYLHQPTLLMDLDPQLGTVALSFDMDPSRGLRDALEKPDRIDGMFLDRVLVKAGEHLSLLSAEEPIEHPIAIHEQAAEALLKQMRSKFSYIVVDVPRHLNVLTRRFLKDADAVVAVSELSLLSLRDALRLNDYFKDHLKIRPPVHVVNRAGMTGKHEMAKADFERGIGSKVGFYVPYTIEAFSLADNGEVLAEKLKQSPAAGVLLQLARHLVPEAAPKQDKKPDGKGLGFLRKRKA